MKIELEGTWVNKDYAVRDIEGGKRTVWKKSQSKKKKIYIEINTKDQQRWFNWQVRVPEETKTKQWNGADPKNSNSRKISETMKKQKVEAMKSFPASLKIVTHDEHHQEMSAQNDWTLETHDLSGA